MAQKSCGTCHRWGPERDEHGGFRPCLWPRPNSMPFWASIDEGDDHDDWTAAHQGRNCAAFEPKEQPDG